MDTVSDAVDLSLVTSDRDLGVRTPYPGLSGRWISRGRSGVYYVNTRDVAGWYRLLRDLRSEPFDVLYVNSLWNPVFTMAPIIAARLRILRIRSVVIAPRGELTAGALSVKALKKRLFLRAWGSFLRGMNVRWHASTSGEAAQISATFPWAEITVNESQSNLPLTAILPQAHGGPIRMVFVGRIAVMKNLDLALRALLALPSPARFDIYGPIEDKAHWASCAALIDQMPSHLTVTYRGSLPAADVRRTFAEYDLFVFPTRGENFGHVIAESLSASCPVLCSDNTPWTPVLEGGGGAVVRDLTRERLTLAMESFAATTPAERVAAKERAGSAYRLWRGRSRSRSVNVIDAMRCREPGERTPAWAGG